jgi:hypothetical protein
MDILIGDGDDQEWIYRRDKAVRRPWPEAVLTGPDGVAYLAPDLQLLFKSTQLRDKDTVDAHFMIPLLTVGQRGFLARQLPPGHPWHALL